MLFSVRNCCTTSDVWFGANAPNHTSLVVQQFLTEKSIPVITQPPYSPDLAPSDFLTVPYSENGPQGAAFRNHGRHRMRRPNSRRLQKKPSAGASNNGRIDGASVCARKGSTLKVIRQALSYVLLLQCYTTFPGTFWLPLISVQL